MKKLLLFMMVTVMCFAFTACGGGGSDKEQAEEKTYDVSDESGIINCNLEDGFNEDGGDLSDDTASLYLSAYSKNTGFIYLDVIVKHEDIKDTTLMAETDYYSSYLYAEDLTTEKTELFGLKGNKITYVDGDKEDGSKVMYYVLIHGDEGERGDAVIVHVQYYDEDLEQVDSQLENIELNWDAYDFDKEKTSEEE